ncbi:MAG: DUF116 domain-containing protein [Nitrospirae bacterium]|nr:DUF116 domain-containing protein [Nitrospirota bacterium]
MKNTFIRGVFVKAGFPLLLILGGIFRIKKDKLLRLVININNSLVRRSGDIRARKLLILLPHCIQRSECSIKITYNVYNCESCGKCEIKDFIDLANERGLSLFVATGGTIARRIVVDAKPEAIVAVACERDLSSGIMDTYPIPILGIINERPYGPCFNTNVDIEKVKDALNFFAGNGK